jgi:plastocyanin
MDVLLWKVAVVGALMMLPFVTESAAQAADHRITIARMKFSPALVQVKAGDVVIWENDDMFRHTATARGNGFDIDLPPKSEKRMTITEDGAVDYYCRFHPAMVGKLETGP